MSFFRINGSLIKNLFGRKPADYEPAEGSDEIRGRITIDTESCTLCGKCEDHCIVGALYIDEQRNLGNQSNAVHSVWRMYRDLSAGMSAYVR